MKILTWIFSFLFAVVMLGAGMATVWAADITLSGRMGPDSAWTSADNVIITQGNQLWITGSSPISASFTISGNGWDAATSVEQFGAIRFAAGNSISTACSINGNVTLTANSRIGVRNNSSPCWGILNGVVSGNFQLEVNSTNSSGNSWNGGLVLANNNNSYGATLVSNGTIQLGNGGTTGSFGTGAVTLAAKSGVAFCRSDDYTVSNNIIGGESLTQKGSGTLTVDASKVSGFTGNYVVSEGIITWSGMPTLSRNVTTSGTGKILWGSVANVSGTVTIGSEVLYSDLISTGVTFANKPIVISGGAINIETSSVEEVMNHVTLNGGALKAVSENAMVINGTISESIPLIRDMPIQLNTEGGSNIVNISDGATVNYRRGISNYGSQTNQKLVKTGNGTLKLNGASTFDGGTEIQAGILDLADGGATVKGNISVAAGTTLKTGGILAENTVNTSGTWHIFRPDASSSDTTTTIVFGTTNLANVTFNSGSKLVIEGWRTDGIGWSKLNGVQIDVRETGQLWIKEKGNFSNPVTIAGTGWATNERRGAIRFGANVAADPTSIPVLTGGVTLMGNATVFTHSDLNVTVGAIASPISGDYTLAVSSGGIEGSTLYFLGANTHKSTVINGGASVTLGYSGTFNGTSYDGTTGTLSGVTTVNTGGTLNFNRTNNYSTPGTITNMGTLNVNSGILTLKSSLNGNSEKAISGTTNVAEGAVLTAEQWDYFGSTQIYSGTGIIRVETSGTGQKEIAPLAAFSSFEGEVGVLGCRGNVRWDGMNALSNFHVWDTGQLYISGQADFGVSTTTIHLEGLGWRNNTNGNLSGENKGALRFNDSATTITNMPVLNCNFKIEPFSGGTTRIGAYVDTPTGDQAYGMIGGSLLGTADVELRNQLKNTLILTGDNTGFSGKMTISGGGTVQIGHIGTVNGKVYDGSRGTLGSGDTSITAGSALVIDRGTSRLDYAGTLTNSGSVTLKSGTFGLEGVNQNMGTFTVAADSTLAVGAGTDTMGQTLTLSADSGKNGTLMLNGTVALDVFSPMDHDSLSLVNQNLNLGESAGLFLNILGDTTQYENGAELAGLLQGVDQTVLESLGIQLSTPELTWTIQNGEVWVGSATALPEPSAWILILLGSFGVLAFQKQTVRRLNVKKS